MSTYRKTLINLDGYVVVLCEHSAQLLAKLPTKMATKFQSIMEKSPLAQSIGFLYFKLGAAW